MTRKTHRSTDPRQGDLFAPPASASPPVCLLEPLGEPKYRVSSGSQVYCILRRLDVAKEQAADYSFGQRGKHVVLHEWDGMRFVLVGAWLRGAKDDSYQD